MPTPSQGQLKIDNDLSRYRSTKLYFDPDSNTTFFGTWRPPKIILTRDPVIHRVQADEIVRPDLISKRVYDDENLWWAIALTNNIQFALRDIRPGFALICPHIEDISSALANDSQQLVGTY